MYITYNYNRNFFSKIDTEEKAYWAGFIAADGNIRKDYGKTRVELNIQDIKHLEKLRKSLDGNMPIAESIRPNNHSCYLDMNSKQIGRDLTALGITPNKSLTLNVNFDMIPYELIHHFIRGYFDGDGSISHTVQDGVIRWQVSFIGTEIFLNYLMDFFDRHHQLSTCGRNFRFNFSRFVDVKHILNIMYENATIYLDRKFLKSQEFLALNDYQAAPRK